MNNKDKHFSKMKKNTNPQEGTAPEEVMERAGPLQDQRQT